MPIHHAFLAATISLTVTFTTAAEPEQAPEPLAEVRIEHLEAAANHLAEAGRMDEANRLREEAEHLRHDQRNQRKELEELHAMLKILRDENRVLQIRIEEMKARASGDRQPVPLDALAADAHRRQTLETWNRIKQAARGEHPAAPLHMDEEARLLPPQPPTPTAREKEPTAEGRSERAMLAEILETLRRIEQQLRD